MLWQITLSWLSILAIVITALTVIFANRRPVFWYYAAFSSALAVWLGCLFFVDNRIATWVWLGVGFLAVEAAACLFVLFAYSFPDGPAFPRKYLPLAFLSLIILGPFSFSPLMARVSPTGAIDYGPLYLLQTILLLLTVGVGVAVLIARQMKLKARQHGQLKVLLLAFVPFLVTSYVTGVTLVDNENFQFLRPLSAFVMTLIIIYAIVRKKLFDVRSFVLRAVAYLLTTVTLSLLYVAPALYIVGTVIMGFPFEPVKFVLGVLVGSVAAINYERVRRWFDSITSKVFFRDAYDSAQLLGELNKILASSIDINKMAHESAELISRNLKANFCYFVLRETAHTQQRLLGYGSDKLVTHDMKTILRKHLELVQTVTYVDNLPPELAHLKTGLAKSDIAVIVRLDNNLLDSKEHLGYMLLGYKRSGNPYNTQDAHTLDTISDVMVIAIQNSLRFEEIQKFNLTLQEKVNEATLQLRRTNAKLKALDETKDDFISMASHQLRTPLTSVKGYLSMVLEGDAGKLTPLQRKMLDQAFVSSQRMVFLIADLLNVSRLKTGKFVIEPSRVNLAQTIADEVSQLKETVKAKSLELTYEKPADFPILMIDETKIRQVIMNFIDNAIYYTPAGGNIHLELKQGASTVEFRVKDTGIGVPKREQPHLFTKFYRAGNARQTRPDGTGLGLFMAKKVIIAQGGAVIFDSTEGKGSTFGFIFPIHKLLAPTPATTQLQSEMVKS